MVAIHTPEVWARREAFHAALSVMIPDIRGTSPDMTERERHRALLLQHVMSGLYDNRKYTPYALRLKIFDISVDEYFALHLMIFG